MLRQCALLTLAFVLRAHAQCPITDDTAGQDQFQLDTAAYTNCKKAAVVDEMALCTCAKDTIKQFNGCYYSWIVPWIDTVNRDKLKFCGATSSGSLTSLSSGSQSSSYQSSPSFITSGENSGSSQSTLTAPQKIFVWSLIILCCCCTVVAGGGFYIWRTMNKKKAKKETYSPYDDEDYGGAYNQDYQMDQYPDDQYQMEQGGQGAGGYPGPEYQ
jgi:hypothetical protein